jgi:hypothetical protein
MPQQCTEWHTARLQQPPDLPLPPFLLQVGDTWTVLGKGPLTIRREKDSPGSAALVVMTTAVGKGLLSARLYPSIAAKIGKGGKGVQTILHFQAPGEEGLNRHHVLFQFGKPESAHELSSAIEEHRPAEKAA